MKKGFIILLVFLFLLSGAMAEEISFNKIINSRGVLYSLEWIKQSAVYEKDSELGKAIMNDGVSNDNESLSFDLWKLALMELDEPLYAVNCHYFNKKQHASFDTYFEYSEIPSIINLLKFAQQNAGVDFSSIKCRYVYVSLTGVSFYSHYYKTDPVLRIQFDEENSMNINDVADLEKLIKYFESIEKIVQII